MFAGTDNNWQIRIASLSGEELLVCWKSTISLERRPQMIGVAIGVRVVGHIGAAEATEEVPEILRLPAADELFWQVGLMKANMPKRGMPQNVFPWIKTSECRFTPAIQGWP